MSGSNPQKNCCSSLFSFIVGAGFVILIYWAIFQPHHIRATVVSATLTNLTVASSNPVFNGSTVSYRLAVGLSLYNPSLRVSIYYDALDAELRFRGVFLGADTAASPSEFLQRRKSGDDVRMEFESDGVGVAVPGDLAKEVEKEKGAGAGAVSLEVAVDARVRYKFGSIKIRQKPKIWCSLTIPVKPEGTGAGVGGTFVVTGDRCSVKY